MTIIVAFDDENGIGIHSESIDGGKLKSFMEKGEAIHYEKMFLTDKNPKRVVYWGYSNKRGWSERIEIKL